MSGPPTSGDRPGRPGPYAIEATAGRRGALPFGEIETDARGREFVRVEGGGVAYLSDLLGGPSPLRDGGPVRRYTREPCAYRFGTADAESVDRPPGRPRCRVTIGPEVRALERLVRARQAARFRANLWTRIRRRALWFALGAVAGYGGGLL